VKGRILQQPAVHIPAELTGVWGCRVVTLPADSVGRVHGASGAPVIFCVVDHVLLAEHVCMWDLVEQTSVLRALLQQDSEGSRGTAPS
jgi:hypothetical protein